MKLQDFIDELYKTGWEASHDAQWTKIKELHKRLFPIIAELEQAQRPLVEDAYQAGQADAGVDPSYSNAQAYADNADL